MLQFQALYATTPRRPLSGVITVLTVLAPMALVAAEPAQVPLTSRVAEAPTPNVMVTIDDSGSMLADFMPEGAFKVNGYSVTLGSGWIGSVPADWRKLCTSGQAKCVAGTWPARQQYLAGVVTATKGDTNKESDEPIYQKQYRSPDVNKIYYNPDLLYLPWVKPDGSGRMANAKPSAALYDPVITNGTFNLSTNYVLVGKTDTRINTRWYTGPTAYYDGAKAYYPGLVYRLKAGSDPTNTRNYTRYDVNATDGTHAPVEKSTYRTDCAQTQCSQAEELQNFANWFTYYRMRESLSKAALSDSLSSFKDKLRIGWGRINKDTEDLLDGQKFSVIETSANGGPMRQFDAARMATVLTGVQGVKSWPTTPLRIALEEVGSYFDRSQRAEAGSPWLEDPTNASSEKLACRRSVNLMMTDGYYNDDGQNGRPLYNKAGEVDGSNGPNYTGDDENPFGYSPTQYQAKRPYIDAPKNISNTLADVATKYFARDLDTSLDNKVWTKVGDIAYWQHLTQFMVGLGVSGTLDSSPDKKAATLAQLESGALNWPDPTKGNQQKIDDMWHAAVNTGGDFYSVSNVTELTEALGLALGEAAGNEAKEAGVATASATIIADNVKYVPKYRSVSWYGDVEAYELNEYGLQGPMKWSASAALPLHTERNLYTWDPALGDGGEPVPFTPDKMGAAVLSLVGGKELADYIRGDTSNEGAGKSFRSRNGKLLGDFVNSPPVVVRGKLDLGYSVFDPSYTDFVARKRARSQAAIVVGGNAGVVHMFRSTDGAELYGYLPHTGLSGLSRIAEKEYGTGGENFHRFFVDGPMNETDAKIPTRRNSGAEWANLVIGSMGAGGKAFFAMHVPTDFGDSLDKSDLGPETLLWEKTGATDGDIGYMFADFAVGKLKDGGWKAFVGNGVYSSNGNAVLLVVDMATGDIEKRLTVAATGDTGLMGVTLIKDVQTQEVVGAYAGDLKGNVWRFDFEGVGPDDWKVGFRGQPLFRATDIDGNTQPITVPPVFVDHPKEGRVVLFGTGKLIDESDSDSNQRQTYYGVWDPVKIGNFSSTVESPFEAVSVDRSRLVEHVIDKDNPKVDSGGTYYEVKSSAINWDVSLGWLVELPWDRQRVIYPSMILAADYVYFSTIVPAAPAERCDTTTGIGYNFLLIAATGEASTEAILDTDGDGDVDGEDLVVSGYVTRSDGRDAVVLGDDGKTHLCSTADQCQIFDPPSKDVAIKDRVWKQILTPPTPN